MLKLHRGEPTVAEREMSSLQIGVVLHKTNPTTHIAEVLIYKGSFMNIKSDTELSKTPQEYDYIYIKQSNVTYGAKFPSMFCYRIYYDKHAFCTHFKLYLETIRSWQL